MTNKGPMGLILFKNIPINGPLPQPPSPPAVLHCAVCSAQSAPHHCTTQHSRGDGEPSSRKRGDISLSKILYCY